MIISPNKNAKHRTKNRCKEHGPEFEVLSQMQSVLCLSNREGINVKAPSGWIGWFATDEINTN